MSNEAAGWGGPAGLSAWEALMWRSEPDRRTRSTGVLMEVLDGDPDWDRLVMAHERLVRIVPRLRERVVEPPIPLVQPVWSADPNFELANHLQRVALPSPGTNEQLLELCAAEHRRPLDRARPPWETTLVSGLEGGRSAILFKCHHSLADGTGLMQLLAHAHSSTPEPSTFLPAKAVIGGPATTGSKLMTGTVATALRSAPRGSLRTAGRLVKAARRVAASPSETVAFAKSMGRMLAPPPVPRSPLLVNTHVGSRLVIHDASLDRLKAAGRAAGGSLNDAYVAGILGALRIFHEHHDAVVDEIPMGMPVSLRTAEAPQGGNRFAGARFAAPLAEKDPAARMRIIQEAVTAVRGEEALGFFDYLSPALTKLPSAAIIELSASLTAAVDLNVSNIRGSDTPQYVAGCRVTQMYPLGPRAGVAMMVAMITYDGICCIGLNVDSTAFPDDGLLEQCLQEGFDEVLAVADAPKAPRERAPKNVETA